MGKEIPPVKGGWIDYTRCVNAALERKMTDDEYKVAMDAYIHGVTVEKIVEQLKSA